MSAIDATEKRFAGAAAARADILKTAAGQKAAAVDTLKASAGMLAAGIMAGIAIAVVLHYDENERSW